MKKLSDARNCIIRRFLIVLLMISFTGCGDSNNAPLPISEVGVLEASVAEIPLELTYTAHTRGVREIEVRSRISGILLKRHYREGNYVKAGSLLFEIEREPFAAEVERAQSQLAVTQAQLDEATLLRNRMESLLAKQAVSGHEYDTAQTRYQAAKASVAAVQASLKRAMLDLEYTRVTAPISGFTSLEVRSEGSLVEAGAGSSLLTSITQDDRLYVDFSMPEDEARPVRTALSSNPDAVRVRLIDGTGAEIPDTAKIEFIDTRVNVDTSTVDVRAVFDNRRQKDAPIRLSPGEIVRARIEGIVSAPAVNIPLHAVLFGADGPFVWILDNKNIVKFRSVVLGANRGNLVEIKTGIETGERVIIDGILKVKPDTPAKPVTAKSEAPPKSMDGGVQ